MTVCFVIGNGRASETAKLLDTSGVPSKAFPPPKNNHEFIAACRKEESLQVVSVFYEDLGWRALDFTRELREMLARDVHIHLLHEDSGVTGEHTRKVLGEIADEVSDNASMRPITAATFIKQRWFPKGKGEGGRLVPKGSARLATSAKKSPPPRAEYFGQERPAAGSSNRSISHRLSVCRKSSSCPRSSL